MSHSHLFCRIASFISRCLLYGYSAVTPATSSAVGIALQLNGNMPGLITAQIST